MKNDKIEYPINCPYYDQESCKCTYDPDQGSEWNQSPEDVDTLKVNHA